MRKYIFVLLTIVLMAFSYIIINLVKVDKHILLDNKDLKHNIIAGGLKDAVDFTTDGSDIFIAFNNKIQIIKKSGKSYILLQDNTAEIRSLQYYDGKLYFLSKSSLMSININDGKQVELIKNLPNFGDYGDGKLLINKGIIYISIGSATNSGIVGEDNVWKDKFPFNYDISPKDVVVNENKGSKTGAFVPYNTRNVPGQKIPGHLPGNASVITYNINKAETALYSWGIRNVMGMDINSEGRIFASVGGMEQRGSRPVKGDVDYIYELKEGVWYGWPDFSGGDPINSPRFRGNNDEKIPFLLQKHPSNNPPAPLYQHKSLSALSVLAADRYGTIGDKDSIYFYDNKENIIYSLNKKGIVEQKLKLEKGLKVCAMKAFDDGMILLEQNEGYLIALGDKNESGYKNSNIILIYALGITIISAVVLVWKSKK